MRPSGSGLGMVALSVLGSNPDASVAFGRWHGEIDRHLAESGLPHTCCCRAGSCRTSASAQYVADQGVLYGMTGETRVSYIDTRDVAAVAARVLTSPGHQGKAYALTGPEALSADEVAERLSAATGRPVGSVDVPADTFGQALAGAGLPGWLVERLDRAQHHDGGRPRRRGHRRGGQADRTPAPDFAQFAVEHRAIFGGQQ